jgi:hypothetical protein
MSNRSNWTVRKYKLGEEPEFDEHTLSMTHGQRIDLVWELTKNAWSMKEPGFRESRLRRDVGHVVRRRR